jgi:hypothetical protein
VPVSEKISIVQRAHAFPATVETETDSICGGTGIPAVPSTEIAPL